MGFYGNITNTSRTQFVFDKVYSSRYEMDFNCAKDGVYAGRYVLVEYEVDTSEDIYKKNFYCVEGEMYTQLDASHGANIYNGPIEVSKVTEGRIAYVTKYGFKAFGWYRIIVGAVILIWLCTGHSLEII